MNELNDKAIIDSWGKNAEPWIVAIRDQQIESRRLVTDQAIIDLIGSLSGNSVLDIGCGEGWLSRQLVSLGRTTYGVDVVPELVERAKASGAGQYQVMAYEDMSSLTIKKKFDIAVCNFSLLGKESVEHVFHVVPDLLNDGGYFVIQTLHPASNCNTEPYVDRWLAGSWEGFSSEFSDPAPWYFRTLSSWLNLFRQYNYQVVQCQEPIHPQTGKMASLILVGRVYH